MANRARRPEARRLPSLSMLTRWMTFSMTTTLSITAARLTNTDTVYAVAPRRAAVSILGTGAVGARTFQSAGCEERPRRAINRRAEATPISRLQLGKPVQRRVGHRTSSARARDHHLLYGRTLRRGFICPIYIRREPQPQRRTNSPRSSTPAGTWTTRLLPTTTNLGSVRGDGMPVVHVRKLRSTLCRPHSKIIACVLNERGPPSTRARSRSPSALHSVSKPLGGV